MLDIRDIHTYYSKSYVLQGVTLKVDEGSVVALMGRNGMGKTTLIRSIMSFTPASRGQIIFKGIDITHLRPYQIVRAGITLVPQGRRVFPSLTVKQNLTIATRIKSGGWDMEKVSSLFPALQARAAHKGDELSGGELQMVATARGLIGNPELLLLDEPLEGLAPLLAEEIIGALERLKSEGLSIFLVAPQLSLVQRLADYVYVMHKGTIVYESTPEELRKNTKIQSQYLGM